MSTRRGGNKGGMAETRRTGQSGRAAEAHDDERRSQTGAASPTRRPVRLIALSVAFALWLLFLAVMAVFF